MNFQPFDAHTPVKCKSINYLDLSGLDILYFDSEKARVFLWF